MCPITMTPLGVCGELLFLDRVSSVPCSYHIVHAHLLSERCQVMSLPRSTPNIYWGFRSVDPHIRLRKREGLRKGYKDSAWCQTKAKLLMEDDDDNANESCLREPGGFIRSRFLALESWTLISSLSMIAPLTCMNNEQRFRQAHFHHADPWIARIWPIFNMRIYRLHARSLPRSSRVRNLRAGTRENCVDFLDPGTTRTKAVCVPFSFVM